MSVKFENSKQGDKIIKSIFWGKNQVFTESVTCLTNLRLWLFPKLQCVKIEEINFLYKAHSLIENMFSQIYTN